MDLIQSTLISKINRLEQEKAELLDALQRFTIWPENYIECEKKGFYHARCKAEFLVNKYNTQNAQQ